MSEREDRSYYIERARQERTMASGCEDNSAALAHLRLAEEYDRRAAMPMTVSQGAMQ